MEYAKTFLISFCFKAIVAPNNAVTTPIIRITFIVTGESANIIEFLAIKYIPEVTIVAACINADTEVGPAIASGNQIAKGNCADFPVQASTSNNVIAVKIVESENDDWFAII